MAINGKYDVYAWLFSNYIPQILLCTFFKNHYATSFTIFQI